MLEVISILILLGLLVMVCAWALNTGDTRSHSRTVRSVHEDVLRADQAVHDITRQAQSEILRLVVEARMRDRYGR
jgi:hypothetical protein